MSVFGAPDLDRRDLCERNFLGRGFGRCFFPDFQLWAQSLSLIGLFRIFNKKGLPLPAGHMPKKMARCTKNKHFL